eukprot:jgi/Tetstr1/425450/TSEL_015897.t1
MSGSGSPTASKMVDANKAAAVGGASDRQLLSKTPSRRRVPPVTRTPFRAGTSPALVVRTKTSVRPSVAGSTIELRKLLAAACVTEGLTPAIGQRLEAIVHSMEAIDDGHRFRLAYLRKHWDT